MPAPLFTEKELAEFERSFNNVATMLYRVGKSIQTEREMMFLQLGLRASHMEESVTAGDIPRARAHLQGALKILRTL